MTTKPKLKVPIKTDRGWMKTKKARFVKIRFANLEVLIDKKEGVGQVNVDNPQTIPDNANYVEVVLEHQKLFSTEQMKFRGRACERCGDQVMWAIERVE